MVNYDSLVTHKLSSKAAAPSRSLTGSERERAPGAPRPQEPLGPTGFWVSALLMGVLQCLVSICISIISYETEHLFICLFTNYTSSLVMCPDPFFPLLFFFLSFEV